MENEDLKQKAQPVGSSTGSTEFIQLVNDGTDKAGELLIHADVPEVKVEWVTNPDFNIDTTQCSLVLSEGEGILPIKWREKDEHGSYAPTNMIFEGGVKIIAGESSTYVPIILSHSKVDGEKIRKKLQTRAGAAPKAASSITFIPPVANMSADRGGTMIMRLTNVTMAIMDYSGFKSSYNVDLSAMEDIITVPITTFRFQWKNNTPAAIGFEATLTAYCEEIAGGISAIVTWEPEGQVTPPTPGDLVYSSSNLPTGNIPKTGGRYTFTFTGSYTGGVQIRALFNGTVLATSAEVTNKQPLIDIPENTSAATRNITFEYKRADGTWTSLPASTNRIQNGTNGGGTGDGSVIAGVLVPGGDIPDEGNTYYCNFTGAYKGAIIMRAMSGTTELGRGQGTVPGVTSVKVPGITGMRERTVAFEYSIDGGATWIFIESKLQTLEYLSVNAFRPATDIPSQGGSYTSSVTGTYSKMVNFIATADGTVIARGSTSVPGNVQLTIPAYTGANARIVTFQYSRSNGAWKVMEVKRQAGY